MLEFIAERRIVEAIANSELDDLPGAGQPLDPEVRKLELMKARIESRYYTKLSAKLRARLAR